MKLEDILRPGQIPPGITRKEMDDSCLRMRNRFRVEHGAQTDFEVEACVGMVLVASAVGSCIGSDKRVSVIEAMVNYTHAVLILHGVPPGRAGELGNAIILEMRRHLDEVVSDLVPKVMRAVAGGAIDG